MYPFGVTPIRCAPPAKLDAWKRNDRGLRAHHKEAPDRFCSPSLNNKTSAFLSPHDGATYASEPTTTLTSVAVHDPVRTIFSPLIRPPIAHLRLSMKPCPEYERGSRVVQHLGGLPGVVVGASGSNVGRASPFVSPRCRTTAIRSPPPLPKKFSSTWDHSDSRGVAATNPNRG